MADQKESKISDDWLRLLYTEAWTQYSHEDNLGQSRTNFFIGIQTVFIIIWTALLKPLFDIGIYVFSTYRYHLGLVLTGIATLLISLFSLLLTINWKSATKAGRQYLNLRWLSIVAIERLAKIDQIGLAVTEHKWRSHSQDKPNEYFYPFEGTIGLDELKLSSREKVRGWESMVNVIGFWQIVCVLIFILGIILMLLGFFYTSP